MGGCWISRIVDNYGTVLLGQVPYNGTAKTEKMEPISPPLMAAFLFAKGQNNGTKNKTFGNAKNERKNIKHN